jgi:hypothetical protein
MWRGRYPSPGGWGPEIRGRLSVKILKFKLFEIEFPAIFECKVLEVLSEFIQIFNEV